MKNKYTTLSGATKLLLWFLLLLPFSTRSYAQGRMLPVLEVNPDARSAAMGGLSMVGTDRHFLYVNPSALLYSAEAGYGDIGFVALPKLAGAGSPLYFNANVGYRLHSRHAVMAGYRYIGGVNMPRVSADGLESNKRLTSMEYAVDFGYAFRVWQGLSLFTTGSLAQSYTSRISMNGAFTVGAHYFRNLSFGHLNVGLKVADFGAPVYYSKKEAYPLPTSIQGGVDLHFISNETHQWTFAAGAKYYMLPPTQPQLMVGLGAEYTGWNLFSLRAGYEYGQYNAGSFSAGIGAKYNGFTLDLAYRRGTAPAPYATHALMASMGYRFTF